MTTKPLGRIAQTSTDALTTLWRAATQAVTWAFSRKGTSADDDECDTIDDVLGNISAPEERTEPLVALNNKWAAPANTANGPWHEDHTEPLEPSADTVGYLLHYHFY